MKSTEKIYDKNGTLLKADDDFNDGTSLREFWDKWFIDANCKDTIWAIEEFTLKEYKDGYMLVDFEKGLFEINGMLRVVYTTKDAKEVIDYYIDVFLEDDDETTEKYEQGFRAIQKNDRLMDKLADSLSQYTKNNYVNDADVNEYIFNMLDYHYDL